MSALPLIASLLGIIFFIGGCLQIAMYVGSVPMEPFSAFFPGLVALSWPLAVAAVIFALVDIRLNLISLAQARKDDDDIHEAPVRRAQARKKSSGGSSNFSYFAAQSPAEQPEAPAASAQTQLVSPHAAQAHLVPPPAAQTQLVSPHAAQAQPAPRQAAQSALFATPPPFNTPQANRPPAQPAAAPAPQEEKTADDGLNFFKL